MPATAPEPAPAAAPTVLTAEIAALGTDLRESRYVTEHLEEVLGAVASAALRREDPAPARRRLAGSTDPAATLLALFVLGETLPAARVAAALPTLGLEGAQRLGLLAPADRPAGDRPTADEIGRAHV